MTPAGIEPATFRFVAQHVNHCATAVGFAKRRNLFFARMPSHFNWPLRTEVATWSSRVGKKTLQHARRAADGSSLGIHVQLPVSME